MILNDLVAKQNVITKLILKDGDKELSKELKVKIMRIRMAYVKARKAFDTEVQEFMEELIPTEFRELQNKADRTNEENNRLEELTQTINSEYNVYMLQKGQEEINMIDDSFTEEEYADIVEVNAGNDVEINGNPISAPDFLEIVYGLFVKED